MFSSPAESCPEEGLSHSTFPAQNQSKCLLHNRAIAKKSSSRHFCAKVGLAAKGDAYGLFRMGERYRDGDGVNKDPSKAKEYFEKAAAAGNPEAATALKKLLPSNP